MKIYLARPFTGHSYKEVAAYYKKCSKELTKYGYQILNPLTCKNFLKNEKSLKSGYFNHPAITPHAIFRRDKWMVKQADIVYANLLSSTKVSIGVCFELAWANTYHKHTILAINQNNVYNHAFLIEAADMTFTKHEEVIKYLKELTRGR